MTNREWVIRHCCMSLLGSLINHVSSHDQQLVSDTALILCQTVSSIMFHLVANRQWVMLLYFFVRQSHWSWVIPWPTVCEWHCCISFKLPGSLINHPSSHDQQPVSDTALFLYQEISSVMFHPLTNSLWVTLLSLCISLPGSLITHDSSPEQQYVSDTVFLGQAVSAIVFHHMTNSLWVPLFYLFARQSHQSCFILWPTVSV